MEKMIINEQYISGFIYFMFDHIEEIFLDHKKKCINDKEIFHQMENDKYRVSVFLEEK